MANHSEPIVIDGRTYSIKHYPEPKDRALGALQLLVNARQLFFGIAEDDIGVPPYTIDPDANELTNNKKRVAELWIASRKKLCEEYPKDKFAKAKLAGAYVNMLGVLADEMAQIHARIRSEATAETDNGVIKERIREATSTQSEQISEMYMEVVRLMPNIRLKGRKADVDGVLGAILGEVVKAAAWENEDVHKADDNKAAQAMHHVDVLTDWMTSLIDRQPKLETCRGLLEQLGTQAKERLNLRREDLARDEAEIRIRHTLRELRERTARLVKAHGEKTRNELKNAAYHLLNGADVIYDMLKQGEKGKSVALVIGIEQAERVNETMKELASSIPQAFGAPLLKRPLKNLKKAADAHLRRILNRGESTQVLADDLKKALQTASSLELPLPDSLVAEKKKFEGIKAGVETMKTIIGILPEDPEHKRTTTTIRKAATKAVNAYIAQYAQLTAGQAK